MFFFSLQCTVLTACGEEAVIATKVNTAVDKKAVSYDAETKKKTRPPFLSDPRDQQGRSQSPPFFKTVSSLAIQGHDPEGHRS